MSSLHPQDYLELLAIQEDAVFPYEVGEINALSKDRLRECVRRAYAHNLDHSAPLLSRFGTDEELLTSQDVFMNFYREFACVWDKCCGNVDLMRVRLKGSLNYDILNSRDRITGRTVLHIAAIFGTAADVAAILDAGADVNIMDNSGDTALLLAIWASRTDTVRLLVHAGASVNMLDRRGRTPLMLAAGNNDLGIMDALLGAHASLDSISNHGWTALMFACKRGQEDAAAILLAAGANVDMSVSPLHLSALSCAALFSRVNIVKLLVAVRANVQHRDVFGATALHYACGNGALDSVRALVGAGACTWVCTDLGETPLHRAVQRRRVEVVKCLLLAKVEREHVMATRHACVGDPHARSGRGGGGGGGATLLQWQSDAARVRVRAQRRTVRRLLGLTPRVRRALSSPTHRAAAMSSLAAHLFRMAVQRTAPVAGTTTATSTAAATAAATCTVATTTTTATTTTCAPASRACVPRGAALTRRYWRFAQRLVRVVRHAAMLRREARVACVDVNAVTARGVTALMAAAANGDAESVNLLLQAKADVHVADAEGRTVLEYARQARNPAVMTLLKVRQMQLADRKRRVEAVHAHLHSAHERVVASVVDALRKNGVSVVERTGI